MRTILHPDADAEDADGADEQRRSEAGEGADEPAAGGECARLCSFLSCLVQLVEEEEVVERMLKFEVMEEERRKERRGVRA